MVRNVGTLENTNNGPEAWFNSLPIVTRIWFASAVAVTLACNFGMVSVQKVIFLWEPLKDNFEIWRLLTPFLYVGPFGLPFLIDFYFLVEYSKRYESSSGYNTGAGGGTADYIFALMFASVSMLVSYFFLAGFIMPVFSTNLTFFVLYIWTKNYPTVQVSIWGFPVQSLYLPFVLLGLRLLMGSPFGNMLHGFVFGHLYYFLVDVVPLVYGKDFLHTPQFLIDKFGIGNYVPPAAQPAQQQQSGRTNAWNAPGRVNPPQDTNGLRRRNVGGGYDWGGSGRVLGSN